MLTYDTAHVETPIGWLEVHGTKKGVAGIVFLEDRPEDVLSNDHLSQCIDQLNQYFEGKRMTFDSLALHYPSTDFQRAVWDSLMYIPFGEVVTYGELATLAGHKGAARAVGTAMNTNPLPILIPCHRVLPADRSLGQYNAGPGKKMWLLQHETKLSA